MERKTDTERGRRIELRRFQSGTEGTYSSPHNSGIFTKRRLFRCLQRETTLRGRANHQLESYHPVNSSQLRRLRLSNTSCPPWISQIIRPHRQASTGLVRPRQPLLAQFRHRTLYRHHQQRTPTCSSLPAPVGKASTTRRPVEHIIRGWLQISSHPGRDRA